VSAHRRRTFLWALVLTCSAAPVLAQSTRDEWLALRTRKQARHHRNPSLATQPNAFTITTIRFFSDSSGRLVGVGEVRNDTPFDLSYSRLNFRFRDARGAELGREWTYVLGGVNAQLVITNAYETLLVPGATGFFKIWTTIPAASMASYITESAGEALPYAKPRASLGLSTTRPEQWVPLVYVSSPFSPNRLAGGRFSSIVFNDDPLNPNCPCSHPQVFTSSVQVSVAAYLGGVLADVQSGSAVGPQRTANCTEPQTTGMTLQQTSAITIDFSRPVDTIRLHSVEWDENEPPATVTRMYPFAFEDFGGEGSFTVDPWCDGTAVASAPWIHVLESGPNGIEFSVDANTLPDLRFGSVTIRGATTPVTQWPPCRQGSHTKILAPGGTTDMTVTINRPICVGAPASSADWLQLTVVDSSEVRAAAEPNFTASTRTAVVSVGNETFTFHQSPASRSLDFNRDGKLDLLWYHRGDGSVAGWWMNGLEMNGGTVLSPGVFWPKGPVPAATPDLDRNGTNDIVWHNPVNAALSFWRLEGTKVLETNAIPNIADSVQWQLRSSADFDRDGDPDLVWQNEGTGQLQVWLMRAGTPIPMFGRAGTPPQATAVLSLGPGQVSDLNWKIVGSGDFNRDGWPDLVWQHQGDGRIAIWKMTGTTFSESAPLGPGRVADLEWKIRAIGDMNGDDMPDLIWQHRGDGRVAVWVMNATTMMSAVVIAQLEDTNWEIVGPR
jgi:hypothetical protein